MKISLEAVSLRQHLVKESKNGSPTTAICILVAQIALVVLVLWFSLTFALGLYHWLRSLVSSNNKVVEFYFDFDEEIEETIDAVADDDSQKGKIEEKVDDADDRQKKGKIKDKVEKNRRRKRKTKADKIITRESHRTSSSDTLRRRHNNQSKVATSFEKILGDMDVKKNLMIPTHFLQHLPNNEIGSNVDLDVLDASSGEQFQFSYYPRSSSNPKPVFQGGWKEYCRNKGLEPGDRITFERLDDRYSYTIHSQRKIKLMGHEAWSAIY